MGFFEDLFSGLNVTGGKTRKTAKKTQAKADALYDETFSNVADVVRTGEADQLDILNKGYTDQLNALNRGYNSALDTFNTYYDKAEGYATDARSSLDNSQARADLNQGYDAAIGAEERYLDKSIGYIDPYLESGERAYTRYLDLVGVNGPEAQKAAIQTHVYSPAEALAQQAMQRQVNAGGLLKSGVKEAAAARIQAEDFYANLDRLGGVAKDALGTAKYASDLTSGTGQRVAGYEANRGIGLSNLSESNAQREMDLTKTLVDIATQRASGGANFQYGNAKDLANLTANNMTNLANLKGNTTNTLAQLGMDKGQLKANNLINTGNVIGKSYDAGLNNLLGAAGLGVKAFSAYNNIPVPIKL